MPSTYSIYAGTPMVQQNDHDISILKTIWRKDESGSWSGHDLKGLSLKPRKGYSAEYFKIEEEMNLLTARPGKVMDSLFSTFGMTEFLLRQSIVPVLAWNEGDTKARCIGTGFFISA